MATPSRYRLHRSVTFWTGVTLLLSFCFAWWYSWRDVVALRHGSLTVVHSSGGLIITKNPSDEKPFSFQRTAPSEAAQDLRWSFFPKPYSIAGQDLAASGLKIQPRTLEQWHRSWIAAYPRNVSLTFVPDWLMALALLMPWAGVIAWRIRHGVEAEPVAWIEEEQKAEASQARATVARPAPPVAPAAAAAQAPRVTPYEAPGSSRVNWSSVVPRPAIPGSPWNYAGTLPLTDTPMPLRRES